MIVYRYVEQPARGNQLCRHFSIVRRGRRVPARVVVDEDDRGRPLRNRLAEYLPWVYERRAQKTTGDRHVALEPMLGVQHRHVELLDREVLESWSEKLVDVDGSGNGITNAAGFRGEPPSEFQRRMKDDGLGGTNAADGANRRYRRRCQSSQRSATPREDFQGKVQGRSSPTAATDEQGEELDRAECRCAESRQAFAWPLGRGQFANSQRGLRFARVVRIWHG